MDPLRLDSKEAFAPAWAGVGEVGQMPVPAERANARPSGTGAVNNNATAPAISRRPWWRTLLRVARDAVIGLALITAVPVTVIAVRGIPLQHDERDLQARLSDVDPLRAYALPINDAVTSAQAGATLHQLHMSLKASSEALFPDVLAGEQTVQQGERNMDQLRAIAANPIWRDVDLVASARAVDVVGGANALPFRSEVSVRGIAIPPFSRLKELTYGTWQRSDYYMVTGEPERAVAAAQALIGLGLVYLDDDINTVSALIGRILVGEGGEVLRSLYSTMDDERADGMPQVQWPGASPRTTMPASERGAYSALVMEHAGDPALPRAVRWEQVRLQSLMSCSSVSHVLIGNEEAISLMYAKARVELVRFPSELAYLELIESTATSFPALFPAVTGIGDRIVMGAATIASTVLRNPRIETCTRLALDN